MAHGLTLILNRNRLCIFGFDTQWWYLTLVHDLSQCCVYRVKSFENKYLKGFTEIMTSVLNIIVEYWYLAKYISCARLRFL